MEEFGVTREQINAVLHFAAENLATATPLHTQASMPAYLELAMRNRIALATADGALERAARRGIRDCVTQHRQGPRDRA